MLTEFEKSQSSKILGSYQEVDIEKSKYKKVIHVHTKNGDYNRVQTVGSEKNPMKSLHHGMDSVMNDDKKQKDYEDHLHSLVKHHDKYYKLEDKKHTSTGRTSFGSGKHKGATEYDLHPYEVAYKKKLHEDRKTSDEDYDSKDIESRLFDDKYHGTFSAKKTAAHELLSKREKTPEEELHKQANDKIGKKINKEEEKQQESVAQQQKIKQKEHWDKSTTTISKEFEDFDYKNGSIKDLASLVNLKIRRLGVITSETKVSYTNAKGVKKTGDWSQFRDWLVNKSNEPTADKTKLSFKDITIEFGDNPYDTKK